MLSQDTALSAAFERARRRAAKAPPAAAIQSESGFTHGNVTLVTALQPRKAITVSATKEARTDHRRTVYLRPSDFVANIASIAHPGLGYQRRPQERLSTLKKIANDFDATLLGTLAAWINEDGLPESLDGLGRIFTCLHLLSPAYNDPIKTDIHTDVTNRQQAAVRFRELNPDTVTKVSHKHKFLARLVARDPLALKVQAEAELGKLIVGGSGKNGISIQAAEALHQMGVLSKVGLLKVNGEWHDKLSNPYFDGLGAYVLATGDNSVILREFLQQTSVQLVEKAMHKKYGASTPHARTTATRFAHTLFAMRNHGRTANRVTAVWRRVDEAMAEPPFNDRWEVGFEA